MQMWGDAGGCLERWSGSTFVASSVASSTLHNLGMCHGDLSLRNLLVSQDGHVKIWDFGTVCAASRFLLAPQEEIATLHIRAPEFLLGQRVVTAAADWWAVGVCALALFTGALPFTQDSEGEMLRAQAPAGGSNDAFERAPGEHSE